MSTRADDNRRKDEDDRRRAIAKAYRLVLSWANEDRDREQPKPANDD